MANIMDYLDWRGDVPLFVSPLNDVDAYLIAKIGTIDWTGIVPEDGSYIPLHQAVAAYRDQGEASLGLLASRQIVPAVCRLPDTARFGALELTGFALRVRAEETEQFSALTLRLPDGRHFVTFRGTDDTIVGWRENCLLSVLDAVPAQQSARDYLTALAERTTGELLVGGHSKGGNLAVYAAATAAPEVQERIPVVYNFDGPGFEKRFLCDAGYERVREKIRTVLSQHAMVGTLLTQEKSCTIVRSTAAGMAAHDGFTWETGPRGFVECADFAPASRAFDEAMETILSRMDRAERKKFVEEFFGALTSTGAVTLTELTEQNVRESLSVARSLSREPEVQRLVVSLLENMARNYVTERRKEKPAARKGRKKNTASDPGAGEKESKTAESRSQ